MATNDHADVDELPDLIKQILLPTPSDIFYHYCSVETFHIICERKTLRFSDINMLNDYEENAWGYRIFEQAASILLSKPPPPELEGLDKSFFDDVDKIISPFQAVAHPLLCSFSREPDVLSQWRAYADDGFGIAVGFTGDALKSIPCTLLSVEYDLDKQISGMIQALISLFMAEKNTQHTRGKDFIFMCEQIAIFKLAYKNPAFAEEKEVRSVHLLTVKTDNDLPRLEDEGGMLDGNRSVNGQPVRFRTRENGIVAYIDIPLEVSPAHQPIKSVWLGPKNPNWPGNIVYMMSGFGLKNYDIRRSAASYR